MSEELPASKEAIPRTGRQRRDRRYITNGSPEVTLTSINTKVKTRKRYSLTYTHASTQQNIQTLSISVTIFDIALVFSSLPVTYSHAGGA